MEQSLECTEDTESTGKNAYMVMVGPFTSQRKYKLWLYAVLALKSSLDNHGSTEDFVVLCALKSDVRMLPDEEKLLEVNGIKWRYVRAPNGIAGFHMGHYKLWAWQHTEYDRIQFLDADLMPLTNMDVFFKIPIASDFVGCPGKLSVLNAGWFLLKPSCSHFTDMTTLLRSNQGRWQKTTGWGHALDGWDGALGKRKDPDWDFFDANGNQGHMYSYFLFDARDLTLIFDYGIISYTNGTTHGADLLKSSVISPATRDWLKVNILGDLYPCPFPVYHTGRAYHHFTGNVKPWTIYKPEKASFASWYKALESLKGIDLQRDIFHGD